MLRVHAHLRTRFLILALGCWLLWMVLAYDNVFVLFVRWHFNTIKNSFKPFSANDTWLSLPPGFPLNSDEVGLIIKTGFSTQERLRARLATLETGRNRTHVVVVGDYATQPGGDFIDDEQHVPVYDVLALMVDSGVLSTSLTSSRLLQYINLRAAIADGKLDSADEIGKSNGWELDIMKHISGLQLGYQLMPHQKWYMMVDDDTYFHEPSLLAILGHLDPTVPHYIGNAIGDYKGRFAHGGSAIVFSHEALHLLFVRNPDIVSAAHLESLTARWGDKLIATTAMKTGIYLDEYYSRFFNGDRPQQTRLQDDRFCRPIISFHKLTPSEMMDIGRTFKNITKPIAWIDLWNIYNGPSFDLLLDDPIRPDWDHVGRLDESTMSTSNVETQEDCLNLCYVRTSTCLAWTWEAETKVCHFSPWMILGEAAKSKFSGPNVPRAIKLLSQCER